MIETQHLQFAYGAGPPLQFPDVRVPQGAVVLLSGPSGSGKSTWLALLAGLVQAQHGTLEVAGQDLRVLGGRNADAWRSRNIGFLPQKLHLSAALTVQHNLELVFWAADLPVDAKRVSQALEQLGVAELAQRHRPTVHLQKLQRPQLQKHRKHGQQCNQARRLKQHGN
jgi:putative ABC transport system ATP-binding protein